MTKIICLTMLDEVKVYINTKHILSFSAALESSQHSYVRTSEECFVTKESPEEIFNMIKGTHDD